MNKSLLLLMIFGLIGVNVQAQSLFETQNKVSLIPILDGDYGGILIPNSGIGVGYSRMLNRKFELEITLSYKVGLLNDNQSLAIERVVQADFKNLGYKRVTEVGVNLKRYLFNAFGSIAPVGCYLQYGVQRSVLHLTHHDLPLVDQADEISDEPRFAIARTIDLTIGFGKTSPWKNNIVVGAYGGFAIPIAAKFLEYNKNELLSNGQQSEGLSYYYSNFYNEKGYFLLNNGFQLRFILAKAF